MIAGQSIVAQDTMEETVTPFRGRHSISGMVFSAEGRPLNKPIRIKLAASLGSEVITMTSDEGKFTFSRLPNGSYTISIDEDRDHGAASTSIDIYASADDPPQELMVTLQLEPKKGPGKPAVVDANTAGVPKAARVFYEKAQEIAKTGDHKGAIVLLEKAVAEYPAFLAAYEDLGVEYMLTNDLAKADTALAGALKIKPDAFQALINRGVVLMRLNRPGEAEPLLEQATKVNAGSAIAFYHLGRAELALKLLDGAEAALRTSLRIDEKGMNEAHRTLAKVYIDKFQDANAADELEAYLRNDPKAPDADQLRKAIEQLRANPKTESPPAKPL